jgi:excisionase family DNA binding protein
MSIETAARLGTDLWTTGQVAALTGAAPRTVSKWFDSGQLPGYRIPGPSRSRRITRAALERFLIQNGMTDALARLAPGRPRSVAGCILLLAALPPHFLLSATLLQRWSTLTVADAFAAGETCSTAPVAAALVGWAWGRSDGLRLARRLTGRGIPVVAIAGEDEGDTQAWRREGCWAVLRWPVQPQVIEEALESLE